MTIRYALYENNITTDPADYAAQVKITGSAGLEMIAQRMIDQGSTVTRADILAVLEDLLMATESYLLEGYRVQFGGLCELFPRIKGVFNGITDSFDAGRHRIDVGANPGSRIRKSVRAKASAARAETILPVPMLLEYRDLETEATNSLISENTIGTINGHRLKFEPNRADEGIYIVPTDGSPGIKVTAIQKNKPSQLVFQVPILPDSTDFHLEVRTRFGDADSELRTGRLDARLSL